MDLDTFLGITSKRIPTLPELVELCDHLGITFRTKDGKPYMRPCPDCREEAALIAKIFRREPYRSAVIAAKLGEAIPPQPAEPIPETRQEQDEVVGPEVPAGATILVADADSRIGKDMRGEPHTWTWLGASRWYYVREFPVPMTIGQSK